MKTFDMEPDDKLEIVLNDPKFGMFSLMKYHLLRGYRMRLKINTVFALIISLLLHCHIGIIAQCNVYSFDSK